MREFRFPESVRRLRWRMFEVGDATGVMAVQSLRGCIGTGLGASRHAFLVFFPRREIFGGSRDAAKRRRVPVFCGAGAYVDCVDVCLCVPTRAVASRVAIFPARAQNNFQTPQGYVRGQDQWSSLQKTPRVLERRAVCPLSRYRVAVNPARGKPASC